MQRAQLLIRDHNGTQDDSALCLVNVINHKVHDSKSLRHRKKEWCNGERERGLERRQPLDENNETYRDNEGVESFVGRQRVKQLLTCDWERQTTVAYPRKGKSLPASSKKGRLTFRSTSVGV